MLSENYDSLLQQLNVKEDNLKHNININSPLLPFQTRNPERPKFKNGFKNIIGEFARLECNKQLDDNLNTPKIIEGILNSEKVIVDEECEEYLRVLIKEYLISDNEEIKLLHPYLFLYLPRSDNKQKTGEIEIAKFFKDTLFYNIPEFQNYFENKKTNHIIIKLILENLTPLQIKENKPKYIPKLNYIEETFKEDIEFVLNKKEFLIKNIENIFAYYYFYYITQLCLKISKEKTDLNEKEKLYYLLDWESASKNRKSINNGYNIIKNQNKELLTRINTIEQVNTLLNTNGLIFSELIDYVNDLENSEKNKFINYLKIWINEYRRIRKLPPVELNNDFSDLYKILYESLKSDNGINNATKSRYALCLEEIGKRYFLKSRGQYGYMLNINQEMLLLITSLCIKSEKIKLNQLFKEYERRGLYFDTYSQEEIINLLTKLNLIDKKSDSGDAQYVKQIL